MRTCTCNLYAIPYIIRRYDTHQTSSDVLANNPTHLALEMNFITKLYQYEQLIKDPARVTRDSTFLINHFYTTKPDYIASRGVKIITNNDHYLIYGVRKFQVTKQSRRIIESRDF